MRTSPIGLCFTSKTCGICGNIWSKLGGKKVYSCEKCGLVCDRDINGARNVMIRSLRGLDTVYDNY